MTHLDRRRSSSPPLAAAVAVGYARLCADLGVTQSMGAIGSSDDNALAELFNAALKREVLQDAACWADQLTCRRQSPGG